jgi:hypothetical protein
MEGVMMTSTKLLNIFYWFIFLAFSFSLFVDMYSLAAFFALLIIVIQLSEISGYLAHVLLLLKDEKENIESRQ